MTRIAALVVGLVLIGCPAWWLSEVTIPLPAYRKGGYADFLFFWQVLLAIYGSVLLGIAVQWVRAQRSGQPLFLGGIFKAGMRGAAAVCGAGVVGGAVYGLAKYGAFEKAIGGNLWGMLVIFWGILAAFVSAGIALLFYAWHGSAGQASATPGSGASGTPETPDACPDFAS
jgi:hypothetical protein